MSASQPVSNPLDRRSYRKVYRRLWSNPSFVASSEGEKLSTLYLIAGPQTNRIGLFRLSMARAAEDLGKTPSTTKARLIKVCGVMQWEFDLAAQVVWIPSWWNFNPVKQETNLKGMLSDLNDVPTQTLLFQHFLDNITDIPAPLHKLFEPWREVYSRSRLTVSLVEQRHSTALALLVAVPEQRHEQSPNYGDVYVHGDGDVHGDVDGDVRTAPLAPPPDPPVENPTTPTGRQGPDLMTEPPLPKLVRPVKPTIAKEPAPNGNYHIVAKVAREMLKDTPADFESENDLVEGVKHRCAQLGIAYGPPTEAPDLVVRAVTSEWLKHRLGLGKDDTEAAHAL